MISGRRHAALPFAVRSRLAAQREDVSRTKRWIDPLASTSAAVYTYAPNVGRTERETTHVLVPRTYARCDVPGRCSLKRVVHPGDFRQSESSQPNRLTGRNPDDVHKNARSVPASRALLFKRVSEQGWSVRAASEAAGMSDRRARTWIQRGVRCEGWTDRSSRPRSGHATSPETRARIIALRRERRTMRQIALSCRCQCLYGRSDLPSRGTEPPSIGGADTATDPVRTRAPRRVASYRHQASGTLRSRRPSRHTQTFARVEKTRLRVRLRGYRRCLSSLILADLRGRAQRGRLRLPTQRRSLVRSHERVHRARDDRQRFPVPIESLEAPLHLDERSPHPYAALHPTHQWQSRTAHSDSSPRMGLPLRLRELSRAQELARAVHALLQLPPSPLSVELLSTD